MEQTGIDGGTNSPELVAIHPYVSYIPAYYVHVHLYVCMYVLLYIPTYM